MIDRAETEAARIALLALATQANATTAVTSRRYSLNGAVAQDFDSTVQSLERAVKPLMCSGFMSSEVVIVSCGELPGLGQAATESREERARSFGQAIADRVGSLNNDPVVTVRALRGDSIQVRASSFVRFMRDYVVPGSFGIYERGNQLQRGEPVLIMLGPPTQVNFEH